MADVKTDSVAKSEMARNEIPLFLAVSPVFVLIALLVANVYFYGEDSSYGPNQIALLMATAVAAVVGAVLKVSMTTMIDGMKSSIGSALVAMMILLMIGALTGTWMMSGIVPAMIYYGLDILSPEIFLFATAIVCAIVSVVTGSSWSTVATVGIALLGIGKAMGIYEGYVAGAIISGAYFGDKISPLSDTTNLAAAMAGTELITHIRYMLWTTVPSFLIAIGIFFAMGYALEPSEIAGDQEALKRCIRSQFDSLSPVVFVVPAAVLVMVLMKVNALVALFLGTLAGGILAVFLQPQVVEKVGGLQPIAMEESDGNATGEVRERWYVEQAYTALMNAMAMETNIISGGRVEELKASQNALATDDSKDGKAELMAVEAELAAADLLKGKGMVGMLNTIWLIITAMCFGGLMEACGLLQRLTRPLVEFAKSTGSLVATTAGSCLFVNVTASDQYLAIVVPGRMFRDTYKDRGLAPQNLSRTLEDAGTVTSVLIPWNTCGAAQNAVLNVAVIAFAPYCFFNWISPLMTILFAWVGIRIAKLQK